MFIFLDDEKEDRDVIFEINRMIEKKNIQDNIKKDEFYFHNGKSKSYSNNMVKTILDKAK